MRGAVRTLGLLALLLHSGCRTDSLERSRRAEKLPHGIVAGVGGELIDVKTVQRIARIDRLPKKRALERAVHDALFVAHARDTETSGGQLRSAERSVFARALLESLLAAARTHGPATRQEVARETAAQWLVYDRPSAVKTTHAVARVTSPEERDQARQVANRIADAVRGATSSAEFIKRALSVEAGGVRVVAESLPPCTADGRVLPEQAAATLEQVSRFDSTYARAANAIAQVGGQSGVVQSSFGFHVILLEERLPAHRVPFAERKKLLTEDIMANRAGKARDRLLDKLRKVEPFAATDRAGELLALIRLAP